MTVSDFIKEFGVAKLARELSLPITTVHSWRRRNNIPDWRMGDVLKVAHANGVNPPARRAA